MSDPWQTADKIAKALANEPTLMASLIRELATATRDIAEQLGNKPPARLVVGQTYEFVLRVRATVVEVSDGHGVCYELELDRRDYTSGRVVSVDADEVVGATEVG